MGGMYCSHSARRASHSSCVAIAGQRTREQRDEEGRRLAIDLEPDTVNEEYFQRRKEELREQQHKRMAAAKVALEKEFAKKLSDVDTLPGGTVPRTPHP